MQMISQKTTKPSPKASRGYLLKLARVVNSRHHRGFDENKFCTTHGIIRNK